MNFIEVYESLVVAKNFAFLLFLASLIALFFAPNVALVLVLQAIALNNFTRG